MQKEKTIIPWSLHFCNWFDTGQWWLEPTKAMWSLHTNYQYINARHIREAWFSWLLGCFLTSAICSGLWVPSLPFFQCACMGEWYWDMKTNCFIPLLIHFLSFFFIYFSFINSPFTVIWHQGVAFTLEVSGNLVKKFGSLAWGICRQKMCVWLMFLLLLVSSDIYKSSWALVYIRNINSDLTWPRAPSSLT